MKQQLKETSISKDSLEFEVGKFYTSGATASQYIKSKRGEQSIALMDWYNDNAEMELKKDAEFICEAVNNYNDLKSENEQLKGRIGELSAENEKETMRLSAEVALDILVEQRDALKQSNKELIEVLEYIVSNGINAGERNTDAHIYNKYPVSDVIKKRAEEWINKVLTPLQKAKQL